MNSVFKFELSRDASVNNVMSQSMSDDLQSIHNIGNPQPLFGIAKYGVLEKLPRLRFSYSTCFLLRRYINRLNNFLQISQFEFLIY